MSIRLIQSDFNRYREKDKNTLLMVLKALYTHPSFLGVVYYRIERVLWLKKKNPIFLLFFIITRFLYPFIRIFSGLELSPKAHIGDSLYIGHFGPTVIHPNVVAGSHLTVMHGCTIGADKSGVPVLGDNVSIGVGASVLGDIRIGDNVSIGPGAVVTSDVESGIAISIPTRIIQTKK